MANTDLNNDGTIDKLDEIIYNQEFGTKNWDRRVNTLERYMRIAAVAAGAILLMYLAAAGYTIVSGTEVKMNDGITDLLSSAFFALITFIGTMIGSYVFGAQMDTNNFRSSIASIASSGLVKNAAYHPTGVYGSNVGYGTSGYPTTPTATYTTAAVDTMPVQPPIGG